MPRKEKSLDHQPQTAGHCQKFKVKEVGKNLNTCGQPRDIVGTLKPLRRWVNLKSSSHALTRWKVTLPMSDAQRKTNPALSIAGPRRELPLHISSTFSKMIVWVNTDLDNEYNANVPSTEKYKTLGSLQEQFLAGKTTTHPLQPSKPPICQITIRMVLVAV